MSEDWKVGDLAVCVDAGPDPHPKGWAAEGFLVEGRHYTVTGFGLSRDAPFTLFVAEATARHQRYGYGFIASRFRKIRPDEHEGCEPEFVTLLNRSKAPTHEERHTRILDALFGQPIKYSSRGIV